MNDNNFHGSFIKSLVFVALVTIFAMGSGRFLVHYYGNSKFQTQKTIEYSSQKSYDESKLASE